jgi:hypothetical protein
VSFPLGLYDGDGRLASAKRCGLEGHGQAAAIWRERWPFASRSSQRSVVRSGSQVAAWFASPRGV